MGQTRREFIKSTTAAAAMAGIAAHSPTGRFATDALVSPPSPYSSLVAAEPNVKELAMIALDAAKSAGADYADVRFVRNRSQNLSTREQRVSGVSDNETYGFGVRTLVGGAWGFAASRDLTREEVSRVAQAGRRAGARQSLGARSSRRAGAGAGRRERNVEESDRDRSVRRSRSKTRSALLLAANQAALAVKGARFVNSSMFFLREEKTFASTDGSFTVQTIYRTQPAMTVTAVGNGDFATRESNRRRAARARLRARARREARRERAEMGRRSGAEAHREIGRRRPLRPRAASVAPLAHDPRIGRASRPSSIARWATKPTTPARASSRRRRKCSARSSTAPS